MAGERTGGPVTGTAFADHFSAVAEAYRRFRPSYPAALFRWLARLAPDHQLAWDCATGSGQAAHGLAPLFRRVLATDASAAQIAQAPAHPGIEFRVAPAEASGLPPGTVDLVTVAQAVHWFDREAFFAEVERVLKPQGLIAVWCYGRLRFSDPDVDAVLAEFHDRTLAGYWPPQRRWVNQDYRDLPFPFEPVPAPRFTIDARLDLAALLGYLSTWSAVQALLRASGLDPLAPLGQALGRRWGDGHRRQHARWTLGLRVGRKGP